MDAMLMLDVTWYENQLARMGQGKDPDPDMGAWTSALRSMSAMGSQAFKTRRAR